MKINCFPLDETSSSTDEDSATGVLGPRLSFGGSNMSGSATKPSMSNKDKERSMTRILCLQSQLFGRQTQEDRGSGLAQEKVVRSDSKKQVGHGGTCL
jgi:hypothetical protein